MDNSQIKSFLNSALGKELIRSLTEDLHDNLIREAQKAKTPNEAYGLLKEASGVIKSIEHMMFLSVIPVEEGNKD